jgi:hypothetical protein
VPEKWEKEEGTIVTQNILANDNTPSAIVAKVIMGDVEYGVGVDIQTLLSGTLIVYEN